jgi:hypothetical protein
MAGSTILRCDPDLPDALSPVPHDYEKTGTDDGSLADGGCYDILRCAVCHRVAYRQLPD